MLSKTYTATVQGIESRIIEIEVDISRTLPKFIMVGLPDTAVKESKERVRAALINSQQNLPRGRITVNLAPASEKKEGALLDLPLAIGILRSSEQVPDFDEKILMVGELSLSGEILPVKGILSVAIKAKEEKMKKIIVPDANKKEAGVVKGIKVIPVETLYQVIEYLKGNIEIKPHKENVNTILKNKSKYKVNFSRIKGQESAKRAMEIAAAGGHNVLMIGPPGTGKTMLAKALPSILPPLTVEEAVETTKIHSVSGNLNKLSTLVAVRPYRSPHHTVSNIALIGGGQNSKPGEVSLAHNGVLFLDELPEFRRDSLEILRQPMEDGEVSVSRIRATYKYPARFMLIAAMNPCPCGYLTHPNKECNCTHYQVQKYLSKISGPLLDRIDIHLEVMPVEKTKLFSDDLAEDSTAIRKRVTAARSIQSDRFKKSDIHNNSDMRKPELARYCRLTDKKKKTLLDIVNNLELSARAYDKIIKVARTIADLEGSKTISEPHLYEAASYRSLDRTAWY